jgi:hypothetical protein
MIISAESVSKSVIRAIEQRRFELITPRSLALMCGFKRFMPRLFRALAQRAFAAHVSARNKPMP